MTRDRAQPSHVLGTVPLADPGRVAPRLGTALAVVMLCVLAPSLAEARAASPPPAPEAPFPIVSIEGDVVVREGELRLQCGSFDLIEIEATCRITARLRIEARGEASLVVEPHDARDELRIEGTRGVRRRLPAGRSAEVLLASTRTLSVGPDVEESPYVVSAAFARHPLAGEHQAMGTHEDRLTFAPLGVPLAGTLRIDVRGRGPVAVFADGRALEDVTIRGDGTMPSITLVLSRDRGHEGLLANGGPVVLAGSTLQLWNEREHVSIAIGYELSLAELLFVSVAVGTDLRSVSESLVLEIASPEPLYIVPSISAGVGVVAREATSAAESGRLDLAVRGRIGAQWPFVGLCLDLDYWPSFDGLTLTPSLRVSL